jgi:hypothetical protein
MVSVGGALAPNPVFDDAVVAAEADPTARTLCLRDRKGSRLKPLLRKTVFVGGALAPNLRLPGEGCFLVGRASATGRVHGGSRSYRERFPLSSDGRLFSRAGRMRSAVRDRDDPGKRLRSTCEGFPSVAETGRNSFRPARASDPPSAFNGGLQAADPELADAAPEDLLHPELQALIREDLARRRDATQALVDVTGQGVSALGGQ